MQQRFGQFRPYSGFALVAGIILLAGACSSDVTAPTKVLSIMASQGTPLTKGAITVTGTSTIVDSTLQVSVTIKNDSTAPLSFSYGPCGLPIALYRTAAHSDSPVWQRQGPVCFSIAVPTVAPGQSLTITGAISIAELTQGTHAVPPGTYYVVADLSIAAVNAGIVVIGGSYVPTPATGTYVLATVNGAPIPYSVFGVDAMSTLVTGTITLNANNTYYKYERDSVTVFHGNNTVVTSDSISTMGTYSNHEGNYTFADSAGSMVASGTIASGVMTLVFVNDTSRFVYNREQ